MIKALIERLLLAGIETDHDPKPIPVRDFDWDETRLYGWGASEMEAIIDLLKEIEHRT
jgi:hypothetical protein